MKKLFFIALLGFAFVSCSDMKDMKETECKYIMGNTTVTCYEDGTVLVEVVSQNDSTRK